MKTIISLVLLYLIYTSVKGYFSSRNHGPAPQTTTGGRSAQSAPQAEELKLDPVCNNYIPVSAALAVATKDGTVYFCTQVCKEKFLGTSNG